MMRDRKSFRRRAAVIAVVLIAAGTLFGYWFKLHRDVAQPAWITASARDHFLYGSVGAEKSDGIPYWVWLVLPRIFAEYLPYPGGYVAVGMTWEQGREMPAGFSKKTLGYVRVAANCALCHAQSYRTSPDSAPEVVAAVPGHTVDPQRLLTFLRQCALDPRFSARELLAEIDSAADLSFLDKQLYRYMLLPRVKQALLDGSVLFDQTLKAHRDHPQRPFGRADLDEERSWMKTLKAPAFPRPVNATLASSGRALFDERCGSCHAVESAAAGNAKGYPLAEIGTDRTLFDDWLRSSKSGDANLDSGQQEMLKAGGYKAPNLAGIWLRGPYLHNGSVPSLRELIGPPAGRRQSFFAGNDLVDFENLGFLSYLEEEPGYRKFQRYDTGAPGHGSGGHLFGADLSKPQQDALLEYLKTL
jgi:mono/diheme cytochrome c family protein